MRKLIGGLLGLCLLAAVVPVEASAARADARSSAQSSSPSRSSASRQAAVRPSAARPAATSSSRSAARTSDRGRATAARSTAPSRQATAERSSRRGGRETVASRNRGRDSYASARGNRSLNSRVAAAVPYGRYSAVPQGRNMRRTAMASCSVRHGRRTCTTTTASRSELMRWTGGLAPAAMSQASCPDGTIATMAIGHNDITRCVPL